MSGIRDRSFRRLTSDDDLRLEFFLRHSRTFVVLVAAETLALRFLRRLRRLRLRGLNVGQGKRVFREIVGSSGLYRTGSRLLLGFRLYRRFRLHFGFGLRLGFCRLFDLYLFLRFLFLRFRLFLGQLRRYISFSVYIPVYVFDLISVGYEMQKKTELVGIERFLGFHLNAGARHKVDYLLRFYFQILRQLVYLVLNLSHIFSLSCLICRNLSLF